MVHRVNAAAGPQISGELPLLRRADHLGTQSTNSIHRPLFINTLLRTDVSRELFTHSSIVTLHDAGSRDARYLLAVRTTTRARETPPPSSRRDAHGGGAHEAHGTADWVPSGACLWTQDDWPCCIPGWPRQLHHLHRRRSAASPNPQPAQIHTRGRRCSPRQQCW